MQFLWMIGLFDMPDRTTGIVLVVVLFLAALLPFMVLQIYRGKARRRSPVSGILKPRGTGDELEGQPGRAAPGRLDGQGDPGSSRARRSG